MKKLPDPLPGTADSDTIGSEPWTPLWIARRALQGVVAMGIRQVLALSLNILGSVLLARILTPAQFGVYAIILFIRGFLLAFGDAGLGASLIRDPQEPQEIDYRVVFTFQQLLVFVIFIVFWIASPVVAGAYHLRREDVWLFRLVALSLLCSSLQVIPAIRMERHLAFRKLAVVEVAMAVIFNAVAVGLAWTGWGEMSFGIALLARAFVGALLANVLFPWRMGWSSQWRRVRCHLRFGIPYQGIAFISLLKDSIGPIYIGLFLGAAQMGYVNWASMVAVFPLTAITIFQRVYMSAFSRMQSHPEALGKFVERAIQATNALVAPAAVFILVFSSPITRLVFGEKWLVALPLFYFFWSASLFVPTFAPLMALLNALGRSQTTFFFALAWMTGTWVLGVPLIWLWGALGYAVANLVVNFSNILLYRAIRTRVHFRALPVVGPIWAWAAALGLSGYLLEAWYHPPSTLAGLVFLGVAYMIIYYGGLLARHLDEAKKLWTLILRCA
ncbi:MAG: oligosaccharide flippase family protein [Candidatus Micrarchaeaceae archaeon]